MSDNHGRKRPQSQADPAAHSLSPQLSAFERIKHRDEDGYEYWLARELAKLLGYSKWENFERVITEAMAVCAREDPEGIALNFERVEKDKAGNQGEGILPDSRKNVRGRKGSDYKLTQHACYIVAETADGRKEEVAWAKIYFALTTERYELLAQTEEERLRIEQRQKILLQNVELAMRARAVGAMTPQQFARFFNEGYVGLYAGETAEDIRIRKGWHQRQISSTGWGASRAQPMR